MSTFCLVHGAFHGSWCWQLLGTELESRGRLGIEARGLPGGHSPFLARPVALADLLEEATTETGRPAA